jgi:Ion channel
LGVITPAASRTPLIRSGRGSGERFGLLLLILVTSYLISAFTTGALVTIVQIVLFVGVALLALRSEGFPRRTAQLAIAVAVVGSTAVITLTLVHAAHAGSAVASVWTALILLYSAVLIVRRVLLQPNVTLQSIYGAISAYMIIGLMFAAIYGAIYGFDGNTFFAQGAIGNSKTFQYFSFTTLTTLGYGDFTAAASGGQAVAVVEAMAGQIFLVTLVARLVTAFRSPQRAQHHEQPAQHPAPQNAPTERRPSSARRWRPPPTGRQRRLLAGRPRARALSPRQNTSPARDRPERR